MKVPAGAIKPRTPRPLTRDEAGGLATEDDLNALAAAFAKPEKGKKAEQSESRDNNGWTS